MHNKRLVVAPLAFAVSTALMAAASVANADSTNGNPFSLTSMERGYMLADKEGKCGGMKGDSEGKCGGAKKGKQGQCGSTANEAVCGVYEVGSHHVDESKAKEGKCAGHAQREGLCGEY